MQAASRPNLAPVDPAADSTARGDHPAKPKKQLLADVAERRKKEPELLDKPKPKVCVCCVCVNRLSTVHVVVARGA